MMAETYFLQALQSGIAFIKNDTTQLDNILDALNANELASAKQYFSNAQIIIAPGFPMETTQLPFIGVTIADESQMDAQTGIGLEYYTVNNDDGTTTEVRGARFNGSLKATIYTPDANLIVWISTVCKWALLKQFDWLGTNGFNNLNLSIGDFEPSPNFLPIFTFARGVVLRAEYDTVFLNNEPIQSIANVNIGGTYTGI